MSAWSTLEPLFRLLGATDAMMPFVKQYMLIWYPGMIFYIIPVVGNNIIRATGDTLTPSIVMIVGVVVNAILDPLLIFGWGPVPPLGISGGSHCHRLLARHHPGGGHVGPLLP